MKRFRVIFMFLLAGIFLCVFPRGVPAATSHEHRYQISVEKRAGEHEDGVRLYVCEICGETHREVIPASGHIWSDWTVEREATEQQAGLRYRVCTRYPDHPHYEYESIPPLIPVSARTPDAARVSASDPDAASTPDSSLTGFVSGEDAPSFSAGAGSGLSSHLPADTSSDSSEESKDALAENFSGTIVPTPPVLPAAPGVPVKRSGDMLILGTRVAVGTAYLGVGAYYLLVLLPMFQALLWANRKKRALSKRLK